MNLDPRSSSGSRNPESDKVDIKKVGLIRLIDSSMMMNSIRRVGASRPVV
jgi:hypothetical protein